MTDSFDSIFAEFDSDLTRVEELLGLMNAFRAFAASAAIKKDADGHSDWDEATELHELARGVRTDLPVMSGSLFLYACGRFEQFVRDLIVALADKMAMSVKSYEELPASVRNEIRRWSLNVAQNPARYRHLGVDAEGLLISLADNLSNSSRKCEVNIHSVVLSITESNMTAQTVSELFGRVDRSDVWKEIGKQAPLKVAVGAKSDGEGRSLATNRLDQLMRDRNGLAHPTSSTMFPDPDQVLDHCKFYRTLAQVMVDIAKVPY